MPTGCCRVQTPAFVLEEVRPRWPWPWRTPWSMAAVWWWRPARVWARPLRTWFLRCSAANACWSARPPKPCRTSCLRVISPDWPPPSGCRFAWPCSRDAAVICVPTGSIWRGARRCCQTAPAWPCSPKSNVGPRARAAGIWPNCQAWTSGPPCCPSSRPPATTVWAATAATTGSVRSCKRASRRCRPTSW